MHIITHINKQFTNQKYKKKKKMIIVISRLFSSLNTDKIIIKFYSANLFFFIKCKKNKYIADI